MIVFDEEDYKDYLKKVLNPTGPGRGLRSQLAEYLNCQSGFISQVINGTTHFSLEHGMKICKFLKLTSDETEYFLLMVQRGKSGSKELENYFFQKMKDIKEKRNQIKERIKAKGVLTGEDRATYYSHWYFAAIHVAIMIKELTNKDALSAKLNLAPQLVQEVLNFLERNKLIEYQNGSYKIGETRIHLEKKSPLISKHHTNWRIEAIKSLERKNDNDLHYSSVITLSKSDAEKIKETLLKSLENIEQILKPSPEEELYSLNIDLFSL